MVEALDVAALVPHRGPALLVRSIIEERADGLDCLGRVPPESPFVCRGKAPGFIGLELAAQAAAVLEALSRARVGEESGARIGFVVGIRDARIEMTEIPAGVDLVASVRAVGGAPPLARYDVTVRHQGVLCVSGTISTFVPKEQP